MALSRLKQALVAAPDSRLQLVIAQRAFGAQGIELTFPIGEDRAGEPFGLLGVAGAQTLP